MSTRFWAQPIGSTHPEPREDGLLEAATFRWRVEDDDGEIGWEEVSTDEVVARCHAASMVSSGWQLYTDGSSIADSWPLSRRGGWGLAVFDGTKQLLQGFGHTPRLLGQTAPAPEWAAAEVAATIWNAGLPPPCSDCKQVVDALAGGDIRNTLTKGLVFAGSVRRVVGAFGGRMPMVKVKAHRQEDDASDEADLVSILGNQAADHAANIGARTHPAPSKIEISEAERSWVLMQSIIQMAVATVHLWPTLRTALAGRAKRVAAIGSGGVEPQRRIRTRPAIPWDRAHQFGSFGGSILCGKCLCKARTWSSARSRESSE